MRPSRNELAVAVVFAGSTCSHADAEGDGLLQDEHQHGRQDARAFLHKLSIPKPIYRVAVKLAGRKVFEKPWLEYCGDKEMTVIA